MLIRLSPRPTTGSMLSIYANLGWSWLSTCLSETICRFLARCLSFSNCSRTKRPARPTLSAPDGETGSFVATAAHPESLIASRIASAFVGAVIATATRASLRARSWNVADDCCLVSHQVADTRSVKAWAGFFQHDGAVPVGNGFFVIAFSFLTLNRVTNVNLLQVWKTRQIHVSAQLWRR